MIPKPQTLYVNVLSGEVGTFDSWARWPITGFYKLSTGSFARMKPEQMRVATPAECRAFARAKRARVEAAGGRAP